MRLDLVTKEWWKLFLNKKKEINPENFSPCTSLVVVIFFLSFFFFFLAVVRVSFALFELRTILSLLWFEVKRPSELVLR